MTTAEVGITLSCYRGDYALVKGCCASIREHLSPDIPICLITHGSFPVDDLEELYGAIVLNQAQVDPKLRRSYGYGLTKMIAFWHSPFDHFLHIDADTICWGDILKNVPWVDYDLIYNEPHEIITDYIQRTQYFEPETIFKQFPHFRWQGQPYFNSGCFVARRGIFELDEYVDLLQFLERNPGAIFMDQGILNFMAFRRITQGQIKARSWPLQTIVPATPSDELRRRFKFVCGRPLVNEDDRRLIHWAGPKPYLTRKGPFPEPMIFYRLQHLRHMRSPRRFLGKVGLILEEIDARVKTQHGGNYWKAIQAKGRWLLDRAGRRRTAKRPFAKRLTG
jgi:hypothetical protein